MTAANEGLIESWRLSLHNLRPRTVKLYLVEVERFSRWLVDNDHDGDLTAVTKRDVQRWIAGMAQAGRARNTIRSRWIALRSFYRWAVEEEEMAVDPVATINVERPNPAPPDVLGPDEIRLLLKACDGPGFVERRDGAVIRLLLATGLRVSELCGLHVADVDLERRLAHVRDGKGGWARVVKFDPVTARAIDRYKRVRSRRPNAALPDLFLSRVGPLSRQTVAQRCEFRSAQAGIRHVHPHMLRHTFAHRFLDAGGQEGDLKQLGGWHDEASMRRYGAAQAVDRALTAYDTIDPMSGL